ncbi:MAG: M28 family peptidase [Thermoplasmatota archaeon]
MAPTLLVAVAATALLVVMALAGCQGGGEGSSPTTASSAPPASFDGMAALGFVRGLALDADLTPRFRMPGTPGQAEGAAYLWSQMEVPGWTRQWQNFTGADYLALNRTVVSAYGPGSSYCAHADEAALPQWPFHNLLAVRKGTSSTHLVLLGAHWDSQMDSNVDPDPAKRGDPDPGANDGASGVGLLMQLMRHLRDAQLPFDVGVVLLDGEDGFYNCYPLAGSLYFVAHPAVAAHRFLLLDMVGDPNARYVRESQSVASDPRLMDILWSHGRALGGAKSFTGKATTIVDDHVAFIEAGIPAVDLVDAGWDSGYGFPPQWDTTSDTIEKVSPDMLGLVGGAIAGALQDPAFAADWPADA